MIRIRIQVKQKMYIRKLKVNRNSKTELENNVQNEKQDFYKRKH